MSGVARPIPIGIVGVGKIARDQHLPAIAGGGEFRLVATASRSASVEGVAAFPDIEAMLEGAPELEAVALCAPPQVRRDMALAAIAAGKHVFLEKPPGATLSEVELLAEAARAAGVTLFASWHSRFAPGVEPARAWLAERTPTAVRIEWKEDVEHWHPGQRWIWEPGGLGVFDPGINALSILTRILPQPVFLTASTLFFPENRAAPIAAELAFADARSTPIAASFDWRQKGPQIWTIEVETPDGPLRLSEGGARLSIVGAAVEPPPEAEYPALYRRFAALIRAGKSEVDLAPFRHVADAFMLGRRRVVEAFEGA